MKESEGTRNLTEALLKERKDSFMRTVTANNKSLSELEEKANEIDQKLHHLNNRVDNFDLRPERERHESLSVTHSCFSYALRYVVAMAMLVLIVAVQIAPVEALAAVIAMVC